MCKSNQIKTIFPAFITFIFSIIFMGQTSQPVNGLSPYHSAAFQFEETVFQKILAVAKQKEFDEKQKKLEEIEIQRLYQLSYEKKIKEKIRNVISNYQRRMDPEHFEEIPEMILAESQKYGFDPMFLTALIITESSFNNEAQSHKGAMGLMQILPNTGVALATENEMEWEGHPTLYKPEINIALGTYYLDKLHSRFGDLNLALEAYNHGPTRLSKYLKRGLEPQTYSTKVFEIYEMIDFDPTTS